MASPKGKKEFVKKRLPKDETSTVVFRDVNLSEIDKKYAISELANKNNKPIIMFEDEGLSFLEDLGISEPKKEVHQTFVWGDNLNVKILLTNFDTGESKFLDNDKKSKFLRCSHCHHNPPEGSNTLYIPIKYIPSCLQEHVYSPDCINIVEKTRVEHKIATNVDDVKDSKKTRKKVVDMKALNNIRTNFFKKDLSKEQRVEYQNDPLTDKSLLTVNEYYECTKPVCSFNCMKAKIRELAKNDFRYSFSEMLMGGMYFDIFKKEMPLDIKPSGKYDLLDCYGGSMSIDTYRKNFYFVEFRDTKQNFSSLMKPVHDMIESI